MSSREYFKKKIDPYKPKIYENKNYVVPDEENFDKINKLYSDFLTSNYDDILLQFNKQNILNYRNEEGKTLINAVLENSDLTELQKKQIIEKLIHVKVSINAKDKFNQTSLHVACQYGYNSIIQLLIEKKVLKNELDNNGNAPIHYYVENFIKNCNDYDVYNKNPNTLNPKRKKYLDIINNLLSIQIIDFIQKDKDYDKKISDLTKLIKFFEIKKINEEYDSFKKDTAFKSLESLTDLEVKNKMIKRFMLLKNNVLKIFDEKKNSITYLDKKQLDDEIENQKNNLIKDLKQQNKILTEFNENLIKDKDSISKAFNSISDILLYLIFIKKYYKYTVNSYIVNDVADNIAQNSKYIKDFVNNALDDEIVNNYSSGVKNAISGYNSEANTEIINVIANKEILNSKILEINTKVANKDDVDADITNLIVETTKHADEDKMKVQDIIDKIDPLVNVSINQSIAEKTEATSSIEAASISLRTNIIENIPQTRAAPPAAQEDLNIFLPLQIVKDAVSAVLLYDATKYSFDNTAVAALKPLFNTDNDCKALKEGAEISIRNAASAMYNYTRAYKTAIKVNGGAVLGINKTEVIQLTGTPNYLMNLFMPNPGAGAQDPAFQNLNPNELGISDLFNNFDAAYNPVVAGNLYAPANIMIPGNYNGRNVFDLIRYVFSEVPAVPPANYSNIIGIKTLLAVKTLTDYVVNRQSIKAAGGNDIVATAIGTAFPARNNLIQSINAVKATFTVPTAGINELDIAETMEIFAEKIYKTILETNDSLELVKVSLDLLILTVFINNQQIPDAATPLIDYSLVYALLNDFISSSSLAYVNSISSKINFFQIAGKLIPQVVGQAQLAGPPLQQVIGNGPAQADIKKILTATKVKSITAQSINNLFNIINPLVSKATAQIAADIVGAADIATWALSSIVILGVDSGNAVFNAQNAGLRDFIYQNLNGYNLLITQRLNEIYPDHDTILDSQKRKEAWDKTIEKLITLLPKIEEIKLTQAKLNSIDVDAADGEFEAKKDEIFDNFHITNGDLKISSTKIDKNSFLYYDYYTHNHVKQLVDSSGNVKCLLNNISAEFNNILTDTVENIDFYDDADNRKTICINYKYFNIHFLIELINKYLEKKLIDIELPAEEKANNDYFTDIKIETIFKIYSNYEKIICIINNLFLILNKIKERKKDSDFLLEKLNDIDEIFNYKFELKEPPQTKKSGKKDDITGIKDDKTGKKKKYKVEEAEKKYKIEQTEKKYRIEEAEKKYRIEQHGGVIDDYNKKFKDKLEELKKNLKENSLEEKVINAIYEILIKIIKNYNDVIKIINQAFSIKYLEYMRNSSSTNINLFTNQFMLLNDEEFPENIDGYLSRFFDKDNISIKQDTIKKLFLILNDFNYNKIFGVKPELDLLEYSINTDKFVDATEKGECLELNNEPNFDDFIEEKPVVYNDISSPKEFSTGYLTFLCEEIEPKDKIYTEFKKNIGKDNPGKYLYESNQYKNTMTDKIIISIFLYNLFISWYYNDCIEKLEKESECIFDFVKGKFEEQYSKPSKETKRILKNFDNIIKNKEERNKIIQIKFQEVMQNFINQKSVVETNRVLKLLFDNDTTYVKIAELVKQDMYDEKTEPTYSIKPVEDTLYLLDNFKEENDDDDRVYSTKIISKTCLNSSCIQKINEFKFNLRLPDKNGNTVIHRLVDQLNERGIQVLLSQDPAIITYKNNNNQTPLEYLLDNYKITRKLYDKKEIEKRVNELVLDIDKDISIENKSKWSHNDTKAVFYNCLYQFNEFIWLKLYEFKNNITLENINTLVDIINDNYDSKSKPINGLLIKEIKITDIKSKLEKILNQNNKKNKLEDELYKRKCKELEDLYNRISNLEILKKNGNYDNIDEDIIKLRDEYDRKNGEKIEIDKFIQLFNTSQQSKIDNILQTIECKQTIIKNKLLLNVNEILNDLSKELEDDYLKILHIFYDIKLKDGSEYLCDFNDILMSINIQDLEKNKDTKKINAYKNYFLNHLNPIFEDFNDLEKLEDYTVNYVNIEILNIIYVNIVHTIAYEIYNSLLQYLFDKYADNLQKKDKQTFNKKVIIKNIKSLLKNKLYDKLMIKNKDKNYETNEFYRDNVIELIIQFINNKLEEDDKKALEQIIDFYSKILENISAKFYQEIKDYLTNQRKIILLLKIYNTIKDAELKIK